MMAGAINSMALYGCLLTYGIGVLPAEVGVMNERTAVHPPLLAVSLPKKVRLDASFATRHRLPQGWESHPLAPALRLARERGAYLREHVRDFQCLLVKRERINGQLRKYEYLATKVRREQRQGDVITTPYSVYTVFLAPSRVRGRRVLYVAGENEGKMLVRNGGARFNYITVKVDPNSATAMRESRYPITDFGLESITRRLIDQTTADIRNDPTGENSKVSFFHNARVDKRSCLHLRVVHPKQHDHDAYHIANIYIDNLLHMPIRVESYNWPPEGEDEPILMEEYTLTRLQLNVGLTDADFTPAVLEGK